MSYAIRQPSPHCQCRLTTKGRIVRALCLVTLAATATTGFGQGDYYGYKGTLLGEQTAYDGYKYGFDGFQTPTNKYLQQVVTTTNSNGGNKTATTTVDQKSGERSTHTSGSASSYGGTWSIDSDTARHRSGGSGSQTSSDAARSGNEYTTEQLKSNVEGWVPPFLDSFTNDVNTALLALSPGELSYTIIKLQYKWQVTSLGEGAVFWDVVFDPDDGSAEVHDQHGWSTFGQAESQVYTVDPTTLNGKATGHYTVELSPNELIQVDAFIPQEYVGVPGDLVFVYTGDARKTPIDASYTTGTAIYGPDLLFRMRHRQILTTLAHAADDGIEYLTDDVTCGVSTKYYYTDLTPDGHIPPGLPPVAVAVQTPTIGPISIQHPSEGIVMITIDDMASDPLSGPATFAPIHFQATITIDKSDPSHPTYDVVGTHRYFPAYEVYINKNRIHQHSPVPGGWSPLGLFVPFPFHDHGDL